MRELERAERREKKKMLEERWTLMKWLTKFIVENEGYWKRGKVLEMERDVLSVNEWETLNEKEK